jgi:acetyltransferase-like isoleucine patch superfamily enzyme
MRLPVSPSLIGRGLRTAREQDLYNVVHLGAGVLRAKWRLRGASHVGDARLNGRVLVRNHGRMEVGDRVRLDGTTVRLEFICDQGAELLIGDGTFINYGTNVSALSSVRIGRNCAIGQYCIIMDNEYHVAGNITERPPSQPVVIEDDVWLGARVIVLPGAHIGRGSVIGANSLVKGCIPPYSVAAGSPAKVIRSLPGSAG